MSGQLFYKVVCGIFGKLFEKNLSGCFALFNIVNYFYTCKFFKIVKYFKCVKREACNILQFNNLKNPVKLLRQIDII